MDIRFRPLHPLFAAEVGGVDLRTVDSREALERIRAGMDQYAVLVFRDQPLSDADQLGFAQRFDGALHTKTGISALQKNRFGNEALTDISNVADGGEIMEQQVAAAPTAWPTASGTPMRPSRIRPDAIRCCTPA
jgi:alpha-ketoglutarate-dependent 2,4-dichlorophenoxyacetate dioxygenase